MAPHTKEKVRGDESIEIMSTNAKDNGITYSHVY